MDPVTGQPGRQALVVLAEHDPQPEPELTVFGHGSQQLHQGEARTGILKRRDALGETLPAREIDGPPQGGFVRIAPEMVSHQVFSGLAQHTDGAAVGVANDLTPSGIGGVVDDAGKLQRDLVDHDSVAAGVGEEHRVGSGNLTQDVVIRKTRNVRFRRRIPLLLVPTTAQNPLPRLDLGRRRSHHFDDLVKALHLR